MTTTSISRNTAGLLRVLGVGFGVAVSLGNSIGTGIMRTPAAMAAQMPSAPLVMTAWAVGALYSLFGAWSLAEVAAMIPSAGAYYAVARRAFGDYVSFVVGWADWISLCGAVAATALVAAEYSRDLSAQPIGILAPSIVIVAVVTLVQWRGVRWGSRFQNVTSAAASVSCVRLPVDHRSRRRRIDCAAGRRGRRRHGQHAHRMRAAGDQLSGVSRAAENGHRSVVSGFSRT